MSAFAKRNHSLDSGQLSLPHIGTAVYHFIHISFPELLHSKDILL